MSNTPSKYKCFSLLYGNAIHLAGKRKIIPADEVSKLLDGEALLKAVQDEAVRYKIQVTKECEALKERAQQEGFAAGFAVWSEHLAHAEEQLLQARKELEKIVVPAALKAAKKIVGREIALSEDTIVDIVMSSVKTVAQHKKVIIYVNRNSKELLERHRQRLRQLFEQLEVLSIQEREDLSDGSCVIETEKGIINARIELQWEILENAFKGLMKKVDRGQE